MSEVVPLAHADERHVGSPDACGEFGETVHASVVRHLQHLDGLQQTERLHALLRRLLGVSGQHAVESTTAHLQDHAGVVGA